MYLTLNDGNDTVITIPITQAGTTLSATFKLKNYKGQQYYEIHDRDTIQVGSNELLLMDYDITSSAETVRVDAIPSNDVTVILLPDQTDTKKGTIAMQLATNIFPYTRVTVFINDDKTLLMSTFHFEKSNH